MRIKPGRVLNYRTSWSFWSHFINLTFVFASLIAASQAPPGPLPSPLQLKLNHKVELLCFADKTIIQTDSVYFIKISLTIFLHEFWFCQSIFVLYQKTVNSGLHATSNSVKTTFPCYYFCQNWIVFVIFRCYLGLKRQIYNSSELPQTF